MIKKEVQIITQLVLYLIWYEKSTDSQTEDTLNKVPNFTHLQTIFFRPCFKRQEKFNFNFNTH